MNVLAKHFLSSIQYLVLTILYVVIGIFFFSNQGSVETKTKVLSTSTTQEKSSHVSADGYKNGHGTVNSTHKKAKNVVAPQSKRSKTQGVATNSTKKKTQGVATTHTTKKKTQGVATAHPTKKKTQGVATTHPTKKKTQGVATTHPTKKKTQGVATTHPTKKKTQGVATTHPTNKKTQGVATTQPVKKKTQGVATTQTTKKKTQGVTYPIVKGDSIEVLSMFAQYPKYNVIATGYTPGPESTGKNSSHPAYGITYSGVKVRRDTFSTIAADTRVFPLGTILYIPGYGYGIVTDTGSAIKGNKIDLFFDTVEDVFREWGKKRLDVYIIEMGKGKVDEQTLHELNNFRGSVASK